MKRISLFGGPGTSKSTTAAILFSRLKIAGHLIELRTEVVKDWAWRKIPPNISFDQCYLFAKQLHDEDIVLRTGCPIVTDAPLLMQLAFCRDRTFHDALMKLVDAFDETYPSLNILLKRTVPYQAAGRYETPDQALELDQRIQSVLDERNERYLTFDPINDIDDIFDCVVDFLTE